VARFECLFQITPALRKARGSEAAGKVQRRPSSQALSVSESAGEWMPPFDYDDRQPPGEPGVQGGAEPGNAFSSTAALPLLFPGGAGILAGSVKRRDRLGTCSY